MKENFSSEVLDLVDLQLLDQLQRNASLSNLALAQQLSLTPPTCLRRVRRLKDLGLIEREIAVVNPARLSEFLGHGLHALAEVTLDRQDSESLDQFEALAVADDAVQQCWRVSPGPDFVLVLFAPDMPEYLATTQRLFSQHANVRNVKAFFSTKRAKFTTLMPVLPT